MSFEWKKRDWIASVSGKLTFSGVVETYWKEISKRWNENTQADYQDDYERFILPFIEDRPLEESTREDMDKALDDAETFRRNNGYVNSIGIHRHYQHLIKLVLEAADRHGVCPDILWGTEYNVSETADQEKLLTDEYVKLRKSLTINEEIRICHELLEDPAQEATNFGLLLMFCLGLRNNEACGASFGDVHPLACNGSVFTLWVYKSTEKGKNEMRYGGKTANVSRIIPVPDKLHQLLLQRRNYLKRMLSPNLDPSTDLDDYIDALPIVGMGNGFSDRCSAPILTKAGNMLFKRIKLEQELLALIDRDIRAPGRTEEGITEKDPSAYLFRRNLGTHLYSLGLDDNEIQYIMGHAIEDENDERSFFRNEEKLYPIARKMSLRPLVNTVQRHLETTVDSYHLTRNNVFDEQFVLPASAQSHIRLSVRQREPYDRLSIQIKRSDGAKAEGYYVIFPNEQFYDPVLNISTEYLEMYQRQVDRYDSDMKRSMTATDKT